MNTWRSVLCTAVIGGLALSAAGQNSAPQRQPADNPPPPANAPQRDNAGQPRAPRAMTALSPEKAKAAWELQAGGVARRLGLDADRSKALVKAYAQARETHTTAFDKLRQEAMERMREGGDQNRGADMMQAMDKLNADSRAELEKSLSATLSPDQTTKALASLGTFNRQWDTIVDNLASLGLDDPNQQKALEAVEQYIIDSAAARGNDREAMRTAMQEARTKLLDSMKPLLTEEQFTKFEASIAPGGRMGAPGGRGGNRGGGGS